jgi:glycosyltransferase involved in cell wall biosynthesis
MHNGYPLERLEVLVIDGISSDNTRSTLSLWSARHGCIRLIDNPRRITPCALNVGIAAASGEVIIRLDAHATYEPDYITRCVEALNLGNVGSSGGVWNVKPRTESPVAQAIACCMSHRFGGAARYRRTSGSEPETANVVPFFCCKRETLAAVGRFNEALVRHQDYEYNARMRRAGYRCVLVPRAVCNYYTRSDLKSFAAHSFRDGLWVTFSMAFTDTLPLTLRHAVPMVFTGALLTGAIAAEFWSAARWSVLVQIVMYLIITIICAVRVAVQRRDSRMLLWMPVLFGCRHVLFGVGGILGLARVYTSKLASRTVNSRQ